VTISAHGVTAEIPVAPYWTPGPLVYQRDFTTQLGFDAWSVINFDTSVARVTTPPPPHLRVSWTNTGSTTQGGVYHDLPGCVPGDRYTVRVTARAEDTAPNRRQLAAGALGIGQAEWSFLPTPGQPAAVFEYTFTATGTFHQVTINVNGISALCLADVYYVEVEHLTTNYSLPLNVETITVREDESWSPSVQASLVCSMPTPEVLAQIDPRGGQRVRLRMQQRFGTSETIALGTFEPAAATLANLTTKWAGQQLAALSNTYGHGYNASGTRASNTGRYDLMLRRRSVDQVAGQMTLDLSSDEAALQDAGLVSLSSVTPSSVSLVAAVELALSRIGAHLTEALDVTDYDPAALEWLPGVSAWDYLAPLVQAGGRRLWCDRRRVWRLLDPLQPGSDGLFVSSVAKRVVDTIDRDQDWYDGVVIEYRWNDSGGVERVRYDVAGDERANRVLHLVWTVPYGRAGAAAAILARSAGRARGISVTAVSDYRIAPGAAVNANLPDGEYSTGFVTSLAVTIPGDVMVLTTRDLTSVPPYSWAALPLGVSWAAVPAGIDWTEFTPEAIGG